MADNGQPALPPPSGATSLGAGPPARTAWQRLRSRLHRARVTALPSMSDLSTWLLRWGLSLLVAVAAAFALAAWRLGSVWVAYDVLVGLTPPDGKHVPHHYTALVLSALGWLLVPALVGAVVGLVVERQVASHRSRPADETTADMPKRKV